MKEVQLSHVWEYQLFDMVDLKSIAGEQIQIVDQGVLNVNAGPDFIDAQIYIDGVLMIGDVEIHIRSSDYIRHKHQYDAAYGKMILHVVYDEDVCLPFLKCPTIELKGRVPLKYLRDHNQMSDLDINCKRLWNGNTSEIFRIEMEKTWRERMLRNRNYHLQILKQYHPYNVKLLYLLLCRVLGQPVNQDTMEIVFGKIPFEKMLGRLSVLDWEAVLLGVSGFLQGSTDDLYIIQLRERFRILKMRFSLEEIPVSLWRFSRMRPANFPPVRLIQLAQLFAFLPNSLQQVGSRQIEQAFVWLNELDIHSSAFWIDARVINGYTIKSSHKLLSKQMKAVIFANAFVPYILAMANEEEVPMLLVSVLNTLHKLPAESNSITQKWNLLFPNIDTMAFSQMIIAQYKMKCMEKACMSCLVGISVCRD